MRMVIIGELVVMALAALVFVGRYLWVPAWWRSSAGRHMMGLTGSLGVFFGMLVFTVLFKPIPGPVWVAVLAALDVLLCAQVALLFRAQRNRV